MAFSLKTPLMVAMFGLTVGLTGCGGSDDNNSSSNSTGNGSNGNTGTGNTTPPLAITMNNFFSDYYERLNTTGTVNGIVKNSMTYTNGQITTSAQMLWGTFPNDNQNHYTLAEGFFDKEFIKTIDLPHPNYQNITFTQPSVGNYDLAMDIVGEGGKILHHTNKIKSYDITGSYNPFNTEHKGLKLNGDIDKFTKLPANLSFPSGSVCYVVIEDTNSKPIYDFEDSDITEYTTLESYLANQGIATNSVTYEKVGTNNDIIAVKFQEGSLGDRYAILYNGHVYSNVIRTEAIETSNQDVNTGAVFCDGLNQVATDYLEQQIKQAYK